MISQATAAPMGRQPLHALVAERVFDGVKGGKYYLVQTLDQFRSFLELAMARPALAVDTETSGLSWVHSHVCGIVIGWGIEHNYYLPIAHKTGEKQLNIDDIRAGLQELLGDPSVTKIFANAKFDLHGLRKLGIEVAGVIHDIVVLSHLLDENVEHGVKEMSVVYIAPDADKWEKTVTQWREDEAKRRRKEFQAAIKELAEAWLAENVKPANGSVPDKKVAKKLATERAKEQLAGELCALNKKAEISYDYIPLDLMVPYACADVHYTWLLYKLFVIEVAKSTALKAIYINEMQLTRVLFKAESAGVKVDVEYLRQTEPELNDEIMRLEQSIYGAVGHPFNIGSNDQLIDALEKLDIKLTKLTKKSKEAARNKDLSAPLNYAVDKEVLEALAAKYPFAELVLKYRNLEKLKNTYVVSIRDLVDKDDYLHTDYNQNVSTGRMSSREPNLTNIPARNKAIRKAFIVPDGDEWVLVYIDFSQVELRLTADRSQDPTLLTCYPFTGKGQDVHTLTLADVVLSQPLAIVEAMKVDKTGHIDKPQRGESCQCPSCMYDFFRNIAKRVNFGIIYGAGPETIQRQVSTPTRPVSKDDCADYIERYFQKYQGVRDWIRDTQQFMKRHGYVQNSFGRYRRLPITRQMAKWQVERACRQGVNFLIQGEAADLFKTVAVRVDNIFRREDARSHLTNFVHDELQFYWHKDEFHLLKEVKQVMEDHHYKVPIKVDISWSATDWASKKELKAA